MRHFRTQNQYVKNHTAKSKLCLAKHKRNRAYFRKGKKRRKEKEKVGGVVKNSTSK